MDHSCRCTLRGKNVKDLGSVSSARLSLYIAICFLCCGCNYASKTGKTQGSLEIRAALSAFPPPFCSAYSLAAH